MDRGLRTTRTALIRLVLGLSVLYLVSVGQTGAG
jgi:hypothetical protein